MRAPWAGHGFGVPVNGWIGGLRRVRSTYRLAGLACYSDRSRVRYSVACQRSVSAPSHGPPQLTRASCPLVLSGAGSTRRSEPATGPAPGQARGPDCGRGLVGLLVGTLPGGVTDSSPDQADARRPSSSEMGSSAGLPRAGAQREF
eukprot:scaffold1312_cov393-Prasinococcus_capsulatus_cf.AAC.1